MWYLRMRGGKRKNARDQELGMPRNGFEGRTAFSPKKLVLMHGSMKGYFDTPLRDIGGRIGVKLKPFLCKILLGTILV